MFKAFILSAFLLIATVIPAHAQWWRIWPAQRQPLLALPAMCAFDFTQKPILPATLMPVKVERSQYNYDLTEAAIMKPLYHSLHMHQTPDIIKGFNALIELYIEQNRLSEAKWYILQCNDIFRQKNDKVSLMASLSALGMLKADMGEYIQARQDLLEAKGLAFVLGRLTDLLDIERKLNIIQVKKDLNLKTDLKYADIDEVKKS